MPGRVYPVSKANPKGGGQSRPSSENLSLTPGFLGRFFGWPLCAGAASRNKGLPVGVVSQSLVVGPRVLAGFNQGVVEGRLASKRDSEGGRHERLGVPA
ncbi:hypothetical protein MTBLM5_150078 [Magnetospirillum sp. LM-5]|nr:hypothetical protein MTBLM5_150078 [Magnetospirillum sp. LM-5]